MAQSVGDLVVSLDVDSTKFTEQLTFARNQIRGFGSDSDSATKQAVAAFSRQELAAQRAGISVGQYRAAMRTLPAQFTDIATQLAGGQSPWLILLQQGGQIKDSFGGLRPMFTGLLSTITPVAIGVSVLAVAVGTLGYAYLKGQGLASDFNKALVITGDKAGQTANNLLFIAESMEKSGGSFTGGVDALNALAKAGANLGTQYQSVASSISSLSAATSTKVEDLAAVFGKITSDPTSGLAAMAQQYGHVTAQQLDYVQSLQDAGKYTDALNYANGVASAGFAEMAGNVRNNMGSLEAAAVSVGGSFKSMWNALLDIGREQSLQSQLAEAITKLYDLDKALRSTSAQGQQRLGMENARDLARQQVASLTDQLHAEQRKTQEQQKQSTLQQSSLLNQQHFQSIADAGLTKAEQRTQEEARLNQYIEERRKLGQALSNEEIAQIRKGIAEKYKDPKTPKTPGVKVSAGDQASDSAQGELIALQSQLDVLKQHTSVNDVISQQRKDLWQAEAQYSVIEQASQTRSLSAQEKSLLAHKDETLEYKRQLADLGDKVAAQQRLNALADQATKFAQQQSAKRAQIEAQEQGISQRQAERAATMQRLQETYAYNPQALQSVLQEQQKTYDAEDALRSDWLAGAKAGWAEYQEDATNVFSSVQQIAQAAYSGLADQLTSLVTTGKASFKDFTSSILKMIVEVINRLLVAYAVQAAMGWIASAATPSFSSTGLNDGTSGIPTAPKLAWVGGYIPEFGGGGYTGDGGKYQPKGIVHGGEFVFTKESTSRLGVSYLNRLMRGYANGGLVGGAIGGGVMSSFSSGGISVYAPVTIAQQGGDSSVNTANTTNTANQLQGIIQQLLTDRLRKEFSPGGILYKRGQG